MADHQEQQTPPSQPAVTPGHFGGSGEHAWIQMSLNQVNTSIAEIKSELKDTNKQLETASRYAMTALSKVKALPDIGTHIKDSGIFMAKTDLRLEQLSQHSVTKGQIAVGLLSATIVAIITIAGAAWWLAEKYLIPIIERLPPPG